MSPIPAEVLTRLRGRLGPGHARELERDNERSSIVSIVLAVYDPPLDALRTQLAAIAGQTSRQWECIVVNDASPSPQVVEMLQAWTARDARRVFVDRPTNGGIAAATNDGLDRTTGDIVTICDHDDILDKQAVAVLAGHFATHPDDDLVYSDEQMIDDGGQLLSPYCKPDFSPYRFLGHNYFNHVTATRRAAIGDLRVRAEYEPSQDYDFYLRVTEGIAARAQRVGHIPRSLYSWRAIAGSVALDPSEKSGVIDAVQRSVRSALDRRGIDAEVVPVEVDGKPIPSVRHRFPRSAVSARFVEIDETTTSAHIAHMIESAAEAVVCLVPEGGADREWIQPLIDLVVQPDVGAVGPRILDPDGSLLSMGRDVAPTLADTFRGEPGSIVGPWAAFAVTREVSALAPVGLTLDCSAVRSAGGLSTDISLDAAVAELCARLRASGLATLVTPTATLVCDSRFARDTTSDVSVDDDMSVAEARTPTVRHERYSPLGTAPLVGWQAPPATQLRRLVASGAVDLVTADVFDTIVTRPVATPSDVFLILGRELVDSAMLSPDVSPKLFAAGRMQAEHVARTKQARLERSRHAELPTQEVDRLPGVIAPECTIAEIWAEMPTTWMSGASTEELMQAELDVEARQLRPISPMVDVLVFAAERGVPVHLVSDIYLSSEQLGTTLRAAGVDRRILTRITTSADHRLGKAVGLLETVIAGHGVAPNRVAHVGDNPDADVATAADLGAIAIAADVLPVDRQLPMPSMALASASLRLGSDGGIRAATRSTLMAAGSQSRDPSFQFGAVVAGPAMAGFARWVSSTAAGLGASTVHCLLREGATIAELMTVTAPDGPTPRLIHASRWVNMRAAVIDGTPDEIMTALARRATLTPDHVAVAFGVDAERVADVLGAAEIPHSHLRQACERLADDDGLRAQIIASSAALRARVMTYLRAHLVIDDGPIVFADVGWGGTIQEGLTRILRAEGIDNDVVGLYFALSAPGEERLRSGALMQAYLPTSMDDIEGSRSSRVVSHNAEVIERILTPQRGTLTDFDVDGTPVCRPDDDDSLPPSLHSAQRAMRETIDQLVRQPGGLDDRFFVDDIGVRGSIGATIADVIKTPTPDVAAAIGSWPHDDVAGTAHRSISGDGLDTVIRYANAHDRDLIDWSESAWVGALAARLNPSLGAQLTAAEGGIATGTLCAPSENGASSLAAFPMESKQAAHLDARLVRTGSNGWSLARVRGPVDSLRAVQFQAGTGCALVDIGVFEVTARDAAGDEHRLDVDDLTASTLRWHDAYPTDRGRFVHQPGGHFVLPVDAAFGATIRHVEVTVGFRCWSLDDDDQLARIPAAQRLQGEARRIGDAVSRRIGR